MEMEMETETEKDRHEMVLRERRQVKKARFFDPEEEEEGREKSCTYFLVRENRDDFVKSGASWYVIDLNDKGDVGATGTGTSLCARKLKEQLPIKNDEDLRLVSFGSCGSLIYGLGGMLWVETSSYVPPPKSPRTTYFYDTANPAKGWFKGPDMLSRRLFPAHQVIGHKIYVLGGIREDAEDYPESGEEPFYPWGEYLDVSPEDPQEWRWQLLDLPPGCSGGPVSDSNLPPSTELPLIKGKFNPRRHIMSEMGWDHQITVCYDVHDKLLFRIPDVLNFCNERPVFVDGDFLFTTETTRVLAFGMLSLDKDEDEDEDVDEDEVEEDQEEEEDRHKPWFSVTVEGFSDTSGRLPPGFIDYIRENGSVIDDPSSFSLLRIAPLKYATLWSTKQEKSCIRLSVFTVLPPSASRKGDPPIMHSNIEISYEHLKLEEFVAFSIEAAVAVTSARGEIL